MANRKTPPKGRRGKGRPGRVAQDGTPPAQAPAPAVPGITPATGGLGNIRDSIDSIDARIHALLNERARFAQLVGISKSASGKAGGFLSARTRSRSSADGAQTQSRPAAR